MSRLRALLATARIANVPSVVSNVTCGYLIYYFLHFGVTYAPLTVPIPQFLAAIVSGISLLLAGNFANDWFDMSWDAINRPERALPRNLFASSTYLVITIILAMTGVLIAFLFTNAGIVAVGILLAIIAYTIMHKRSPRAVIWMGACRGGLYLLGFFASNMITTGIHAHPLSSDFKSGPLFFLTHTPFLPALGLACYIAGLSLYARCESLPDSPISIKRFALFLFCVPIMTHTFWAFLPEYRNYLSVLPGVVLFVTWVALCLTIWKRPIPKLVSGLLAGIPLVDAMLVFSMTFVLDQYTPWNGMLTAFVCIPLLAFALGRLLQRVAPAT